MLSPTLEADLLPGQYAYRPGRSVLHAVQRPHRLLNTGHREMVDADLSDYFGQIPHAELMKSLARRVSDGQMLGWIKAWLEMALEEDERGRRHPAARTGRVESAKGPRKGPPISPLLSRSPVAHKGPVPPLGPGSREGRSPTIGGCAPVGSSVSSLSTRPTQGSHGACCNDMLHTLATGAHEGRDGPRATRLGALKARAGRKRE